LHPALDSGDDAIGVSGPHEGLGIGIGFGEEAVNGGLEIDDVEGGKQRGRAVPLLLVGHRAGPPLLERQSGLGAVERLDLRFLVDREHDGLRDGLT
jgi:hypothetical protein